jgi:hypothetical protein
MIYELAVFPQYTLSEGQGLTGTRKWTIDPDNDIFDFVKKVCKSHWPGYQDCIPTSVQVGPFFDETVIKQRSQPRTILELGSLPVYGSTLVIAQYAMHRMTNCWPDFLGTKPQHPAGTTLTCRVRGSGQVVLLAPAGMRAAGMKDTECPESGRAQQGIGTSANTRLLIPTTEYLLTCDRMTHLQVENAMDSLHWDFRIGTVNNDWFCGAEPGTMLFENWEMDETFVPDPERGESNRYRLSCVLRARVVVDENLEPVIPINDKGEVTGWNQDFILQGTQGAGWYSVKTISAAGACTPRYPFADFANMFADSPGPDTSQCDTAGSDGGDLDDPCLQH